MSVPVSLPVGPGIVRVFCGYKLPSLSRDAFYKELGETFMPGTPYMQAPLGLNAYLPAVLDPPDGSGLPDEVALIVYASMEQYLYARETSLRRRIYTHAHTAVFDMQAPGGGGQFPGPATAPDKRGERHSWYLFDNQVDWQDGQTVLFFLAAQEEKDGLREEFIERSVSAKGALQSAGVDQLVAVATNAYASIWLHSQEQIQLPDDAFQFAPRGVEVMRRFRSQLVPMPNLEEGAKITEPSMYCFRFVREKRFHL